MKNVEKIRNLRTRLRQDNLNKESDSHVNFSPTNNYYDIEDSEIIILCLPTPLKKTGIPDPNTLLKEFLKSNNPEVI